MKSLTPSQISIIEYCDREFWISQHLPQRHSVASFGLQYGSATHEGFRVAGDEFKTTWPELKLDQLPAQIPIDVDAAIEYVSNMFKTQHPEFFLQMQRQVPLLKLAINQWGGWLYQEVSSLVKKGISFKQAIDMVIPTSEVKLVSRELGMHGRADQIKNVSGNLSITDLKSDERTTSYLHQNGHYLQLLSYAVMGQETLNSICTNVNLLYTKSMELIKYPFNKKAENYLKKKLNQCRTIIDLVNPPPLLKGLEADVKCPRCYHREECLKLADEVGELHEIS